MCLPSTVLHARLAWSLKTPWRPSILMDSETLSTNIGREFLSAEVVQHDFA